MFYIPDANPLCIRLHLLSEVGDPGELAGPGTSLGYVEQTVRKDPWNQGKRSDVELVACSNVTHIRAAVPDFETGMAIVLMNLKGNDGNT